MINKTTNELVFQSGENWHTAKSSALVDVLYSNSTGRPEDSRGRSSNRNSTGHPIEIFIAFFNEIDNSKTFEANLHGHPVESYRTSLSSRI